MTNRAVRIACGLALTALPFGALPALAQTQSNMQASASDQQFIDQAARSGLAEVQEGQLAEKQAHRASVRSFAQTMVRDHDWVNQKLNLIAQKMGVTPPTTLDSSQMQMIDALKGAHGSTFDRRYLDQQAQMHQEAIALFRTEAQQGNDPDLKHFASVVLPRLEEHLRMVEKLGGHAATS